jgi:RHS repeat-associated protein
VKKSSNTSNTTTKYFYDGSILLAEKVGNQIQKIYINDGQGIVGMVRPIYDGSTLTHYQRLYYLYDSLGSVSAVTGEHGLPLTSYTYSPFGTCLNVTGDPINNLQFIGRYGGYLDNDTGLTYFWHRWYDSKDGRWISRDPIGVKGGMNLMEYSGNRPTLITDSNGLGWCGPGHHNLLEWFIPEGPWGALGGDLFSPSCQAHDQCYGTCGASKSQCDNKLCENLVHSCMFYSGDRGNCIEWASMYCQGVKDFAGDAYRNAQANCKKDCSPKPPPPTCGR